MLKNLPLFDWRYIKSCQIGIKQLSGCVILNLGYHLNDSRMKWFRRGVNPNSILFYKKINFLLLTFQRWTAQEKSHIFKNHVCHSTSFSSSYLFSIRQVHFSKTVVHTPTCWYFQKLFETIFNMRYYTKKYRFLSKTAKWNQKKITVLKRKKNVCFLENWQKCQN